MKRHALARLLAGLATLLIPVPALAANAASAPTASGPRSHGGSWATSALHASLEAGAAWQSRNDFRIPGDGGSLVRLAGVDSGPVAVARATLTWNMTAHHSLRLLAAPLRLQTTFTPTDAVSFQDQVFPAGRPVEAVYVFNSYRVTWYWRFRDTGRWALRLGGTLKIRDAEIGLTGEPGQSAKTDLGAVPLVYLYARFQASDRLAFELEADAAVAPQGRAEDASLKSVFRLSDRVEIDLGYRLLEGGADIEAVYTFAFFHYAVAAVRVRF